MTNQQKTILQKICILAGISLLVIGAAVMIFWQWNIRTSQKRTEAYVHTIRTLIPEPQGAVPEARTDNTMPALSLDGADFIGILELPRYGSSLPVCGNWGKLTKYPCRFDGSVYDGTLQIGATTQQGQYDFYREISVGDSLYFTDMAGNRYTYTVSNLRYEKHADQAALHRTDAALTLFVKNVYAFEYIVIFCDLPA